MGVDPVELSHEQKYFDAAWEHRERTRRNLRRAAGAAANGGAAARISRDAQDRMSRLGGPEDPVAFGKIVDEDGEVLYLGNHAISDDSSELVVINWQAPAAARYYEATHADPRGLQRKRAFRCAGNTIKTFEDTLFSELAADVEELEALETPSDVLLADLESNRTGTMQDIVRTIQAAQFDLIRAPLDQLLVIQGGPGTGKTAVALHRVSWLLFNHRGRLSGQEILIIGPNPTFTRYTRTVLPGLGDASVAQLDINELLAVPGKHGRLENSEVAKLKGDSRMAGLVRRALYNRVRLPQGQQRVEIQVDHQKVVLTAEKILLLIDRALAATGTYADRRSLFRDLIVEMVFKLVRVGKDRVRTSLEALVDRVWPPWTAESFLRNLYSSRERLAAAAGDEFTAREVSLLYRRAAGRISEERWSDADLALLDEVHNLLYGVDGPQLAHIVVDEAQDLSPMQLRSIARLSETGSMTIVGDIAQSTGPWARDDWDEVLSHLPANLPCVREELRYGYRVPRQVFDLAAELLPVAAPTVQPPQAVRDGPAAPLTHQVDEDGLVAECVKVAMGHAAHGRSVAIICPAFWQDGIQQELAVRDVAWRAASKGELGPGVNLVSPQDSKGLEFDSVIVVEPQGIIAEDQRGHRLLYVALTRTTRYLDIISTKSCLFSIEDEPKKVPARTVGELAPIRATGHWASLMSSVSARDPEGGTAPQSGNRSRRLVEIAAEEVVTLLRETVAPNLWKPVLARASQLVDKDE